MGGWIFCGEMIIFVGYNFKQLSCRDMPSLKKIVIQNFRNIELQELEFSPKMNCICGGNGEGKTNLLDAIWYLSMTKSAFLPGDKFGFRYGCDSFGLSGTYAMESGPDTRISIQVSGNGEKKVKRDDKQYTRLSDHIGLIPVVMVSPMDANLVMDAAEDRRKFVNSVLSQVDKTYLSNVQIYLRLLQQRNKLLKEQRGDEKGPPGGNRPEDGHGNAANLRSQARVLRGDKSAAARVLRPHIGLR